MPSSSFWKKNLFSLKNNAILHNRVILYFIFLVSLGNFFYLTVERDITSIVIFLLVGFLTSFFSKNMLIILFIALITSSILKHGVGVRHEGLENMIDPPEYNEIPAEEPAEQEETDLSNEKYLEYDENGNPRKRKVENYKGGDEEEEEEEVDEDEDIVENYDGEEEEEEEEEQPNQNVEGYRSGRRRRNTNKSNANNENNINTLKSCVRKCIGM